MSGRPIIAAKVHVCFDDAFVHHLVQHNCYKVVKSAMQVPFIDLANEGCYKHESLMEEVVLGWRGTSSKY